MPYIKQEAKEKFSQALSEIRSAFESSQTGPGDLNFLISKTILEYLHNQPVKHLSYQEFNDVMGALEGAKLEFYRRMVVPYEQQKIKENGDIYPHA